MIRGGRVSMGSLLILAAAGCDPRTDTSSDDGDERRPPLVDCRAEFVKPWSRGSPVAS